MRRRRPRIAIADTPEPRPPLIHEVAAALPVPVRTSADEVDGPTPCATCGGPAERSEPHWGVWRQHRGCERVQGEPAARLEAAARALGRRLDRTDALLLPFSAERYSTGHPEPTWTDEPLRLRLPWRHLDREALYAAIERLPELRVAAGLVPATCTDGRCAWCGVAEAVGWSAHGHTWADGTPAPLCGACSERYSAAGAPDPSWWDAQRAAIASAACAVPAMMGETAPAGLHAFAEGDEDGTGEPWSHLDPDALDAFRWGRWGRFNGAYAPPEHRAEALRRAQAADAAVAERMAAKAAEEAARADVFGFARSQ